MRAKPRHTTTDRLHKIFDTTCEASDFDLHKRDHVKQLALLIRFGL